MGWLQRLLIGDNSDTSASSLPSAVENWQKQPGRPDHSQQVTGPEASSQKAGFSHDAEDQKVVPEVEVTRVESHQSGDGAHVEVWVEIKNLSELEVEVKKVSFLKQRYDLGQFLKPGESRKVCIYRGDTPTNDGEHRCEVQYKISESGDYFQADHDVRYHYEKNEHGEWYVPEEMRLIRPIRDI